MRNRSRKTAFNLQHGKYQDLIRGSLKDFITYDRSSERISSGNGNFIKLGRHPLYGIHAEFTAYKGTGAAFGGPSIDLAGFGKGTAYLNQTFPPGLAVLMDESGQVKRVDITIDYMGRNGTWHQVFHELILKFDSPFKRHYTFPQETYVIRNGKIVYQRKDPDFAEYDDHNWYAH